MSKVGMLLKVDDLRTVWKNEERDFSANWIGCFYQMVKQAELWLLNQET